MMMTNDKIVDKWGASAARFYARCEGEEVAIHLLTGDKLVGTLTGVDKYDVFIERDDAVILIAKHAIAWIEPGVQDVVTRRLEEAATGDEARSS